MEPMPPEAIELLTAANPAVIATVDAERHPVCVATWFTLESPDTILLTIMTEGARGGRLDHLRANPHLALTVMNTADWTDAVNLQGIVTEFFEDTDLTAVDEMAERHLGRPFADRSPRTCARVRITRWHHPRPRW